MSRVVTVVGALWGDEGKGKFVDYMCKEVEADVAVRYSGGSNAGHTIKLKDGKSMTFRLLPTGSVRPGVKAVLGSGMVIDPDVLVEEIEKAKEINPEFDLLIDFRAHIILPSHREVDSRREVARENKIGTTKSGIGVAYSDKANRVGMRMVELLRSAESAFEETTKLAKEIHGSEDIVSLERVEKWKDKLSKYIGDGSRFINDEIDNGKNIVFAGAQGAMLDIDYGTYPFVTSTTCLPCGVGSGAGVDPRKVGEVIGVVKAYCTRIGEGTFPTEIFNQDTVDIIRKKGNEYEHGVYIDRPRRIGWLDAEALELSARVGGYDWLAVTMLDILGELDEICIPGRSVFSGWDTNIGNAESVHDLPVSLLRYLSEIEDIAGCRVGFISTGSRTDQVIDIRGLHAW